MAAWRSQSVSEAGTSTGRQPKQHDIRACLYRGQLKSPDKLSARPPGAGAAVGRCLVGLFLFRFIQSCGVVVG